VAEPLGEPRGKLTCLKLAALDLPKPAAEEGHRAGLQLSDGPLVGNAAHPFAPHRALPAPTTCPLPSSTLPRALGSRPFHPPLDGRRPPIVRVALGRPPATRALR